MGSRQSEDPRLLVPARPRFGKLTAVWIAWQAAYYGTSIPNRAPAYWHERILGQPLTGSKGQPGLPSATPTTKTAPQQRVLNRGRIRRIPAHLRPRIYGGNSVVRWLDEVAPGED